MLLLLACATGALLAARGMRRIAAGPDYAAIARMEREIWGQAFTHTGAPAASARPGAGLAVPAEAIRAHLAKETDLSWQIIDRIVRDMAEKGKEGQR